MQYEEWMEEGKRGIIRSALTIVEKKGLSPPHQLYFTFRTDYPGVQIPQVLRSVYPEEMSIAIKDAFWNLVVAEEFFSVDLIFDEKRDTVTVPYKAIINFIDPGAEFGLQFDWERNIPTQVQDNVIFLDQFRRQS